MINVNVLMMLMRVRFVEIKMKLLPAILRSAAGVTGNVCLLAPCVRAEKTSTSHGVCYVLFEETIKP